MKTSLPWRLIRTLIISFLVTLLLLTGLTFLLYKFRLGESQIAVGIYAIYILSCFLGGILAGKAMKSRRFLWGLLTGLLYFIFLFGISALQEQGISTDWSRILLVLGICAGSAMAGGMIS